MTQRRHRLVGPLVVLALARAAPSASADAGNAPTGDYFARGASTNEVVVRTPGARTPAQRRLIAGVLGGAAALGGLGLYFHLDGKRAADRVSADAETDVVWSRALQADYDHAERYRDLAIVSYALGGAALVAAAVIVLRTAPPDVVERKQIALPAIAPVRGGAIASLGWSF
jgi:hypothetical protein